MAIDWQAKSFVPTPQNENELCAAVLPVAAKILRDLHPAIAEHAGAETLRVVRAYDAYRGVPFSAYFRVMIAARGRNLRQALAREQARRAAETRAATDRARVQRAGEQTPAARAQRLGDALRKIDALPTPSARWGCLGHILADWSFAQTANLSGKKTRSIRDAVSDCVFVAL